MADAQGNLIARCALLLALVVTPASGQPSPALPTDAGFSSRLSASSGATEYWDLTADLQSSGRLFLRFLVTNEGPGARTAAAAGHLILPGGDVVPIKFGRTSGSWELSADRRRLKIASAILDLSNPDSSVDVDSDKHGIKIRLLFTRPEAPIHLAAGADYDVEVMTPVPTRGTVWTTSMSAPIAVEGTVGLTHTWMEREESEILARRADLMARLGDVGLYLLHLALSGGNQRGFVVLTRAGRPLRTIDDGVWDLQSPQEAKASEYPVPREWAVRSPDVEIKAHLRREILRWDPLEVIPQPFRFVIGLRTQPQKIWADADVEISVSSGSDLAPLPAAGSGIASVAFARPGAVK